MATLQSPSVFELVACDQLKGGLREAIRYLLERIYQIEVFQRLSIPRTDEAVLILDLIIEYFHLKSYDASYAENLYNLVRVSSDGSKKIKIIPSLVVITLIPYVKHKLDKHFEELNYKDIRTADDINKIRLYRILSGSCSLLNLVCLVRFAAGRATYHNFIDGVLKLSLECRLDIDGPHTTDLSLADRISKRVADFMSFGLTFGSYVIQFLDYWNTHSNSAPLFKASLPIPDPPSKDSLAHADEGSSKICLICLHVRQNECALSNTGYVFCYSCLQRYVTKKRRCPVTGHPTTVDNIVKLFTSSPF